jgi:hypothetical protein
VEFTLLEPRHTVSPLRVPEVCEIEGQKLVALLNGSGEMRVAAVEKWESPRVGGILKLGGYLAI